MWMEVVLLCVREGGSDGAFLIWRAGERESMIKSSIARAVRRALLVSHISKTTKCPFSVLVAACCYCMYTNPKDVLQQASYRPPAFSLP
jgi:hypothetical protein